MNRRMTMEHNTTASRSGEWASRWAEDACSSLHFTKEQGISRTPFSLRVPHLFSPLLSRALSRRRRAADADAAAVVAGETPTPRAGRIVSPSMLRAARVPLPEEGRERGPELHPRRP